MNCPKCPGQLDLVSHGGVHFDRCQSCFGLWFDKDELEKFNPFDADFPLSPTKSVDGKHTRLRCPRCHGFLKETLYAPGTDFEVDRCTDCKGVWLDADEILKIQKILKGEVKSRRKSVVQIQELARREQELSARRENEIAVGEARDEPSTAEFLFMFFTRLPREVHHPVHRFPKATVALIGANLLAFLLQIAVLAGPGAEDFLLTYGFVPVQFRQMQHPWALVTSMFLHGGIVHLLGNMYFLYTFGDNVEDYLGSLPFCALYFLSGVMAAMAHFGANIHSTIPVIGASGAVSGILAAYMVLFSRRKIYVLIWFFPIKVMAVWYLGFWIAFQIFSGVTQEGVGGVAYLAHVGGFLTGLASAATYRALKKTTIAAQPA